MEETKNQDNLSLDEFIRNIEDQELKGILLKLKNEMKKPEVPWDVIRSILISLKSKDRDTMIKILPIILT